MKTMNENQPFEIENKGKGNSDVEGIDKSTSTTICPALHHIGIMTLHLDEMVDWYGKVLGTKLTFKSSSPLGKNSSMSMSGVWLLMTKPITASRWSRSLV